MDNTRPVRTNTADRASCMSMTQMYVRILVCTVSFQWNIQTNTVHSSVHQVVTTHYGDGGYPQQRPKLRVAWQVMDNTRPVRANTADRAPHTLTTQGYVRRLICTVCFQGNIHTNRVHSSEQNNKLRCRWIPSRTIKLRVMNNTRPVRANTADRAAFMLMTRGYVRILVCTVCFQ